MRTPPLAWMVVLASAAASTVVADHSRTEVREYVGMRHLGDGPSCDDPVMVGGACFLVHPGDVNVQFRIEDPTTEQLTGERPCSAARFHDAQHHTILSSRLFVGQSPLAAIVSSSITHVHLRVFVWPPFPPCPEPAAFFTVAGTVTAEFNV